ncbi:MAG: hypothetical protein H6686_02965 [Fibrobacteria bacterium]|nr:hypothetical protein [Fibrobacteria bacterium]
MDLRDDILRHVRGEVRGVQARVEALRPFSTTVPMAPAAAPSPRVVAAMDRHLSSRRRELRRECEAFLAWLDSADAQRVPPASLQRRYTLLKLRFGAILEHLDIFADALVQRAQIRNGLWLSGLDRVAEDGLSVLRAFDPPPLLCHLDRGHGAAIRRATTRLPGGHSNPVSIVRIPRERMVGGGVAGSLLHEVGHQAAALLDLVAAARRMLELRGRSGRDGAVWKVFSGWASEMLADLWALGHLGIAATTGLIGVLSLPAPLLFRVSPDDPHPMPWLRVKIGCAFGRALLPDPRWDRMEAMWEAMVPRARAKADSGAFIARMEPHLPELSELLAGLPIPLAGGRKMSDLLPLEDSAPTSGEAAWSRWKARPEAMVEAGPCRVLAAMGLARFDGDLEPRDETRILEGLLERWALESSLTTPSVRDGAPRLGRAA